VDQIVQIPLVNGKTRHTVDTEVLSPIAPQICTIFACSSIV